MSSDVSPSKQLREIDKISLIFLIVLFITQCCCLRVPPDMPDYQRFELFPVSLFYTNESNSVIISNTTNISYRQNPPICTKQLIHSKAPGHIVCHWLSLIREYRIFYHMNSVYVSNQGIVQDGKRIFPRNNKTTKKETEVSMMGFRKAIIAISKSNTYGHYIADHLCSLILIPSSYFVDSVILIAFDANVAKTYLKCLGIPFNEVYQLTDEWYYASEAYFLRSKEVINSLNVDGLPNLQKRFFKYFNLSEIAPTKYRILNRIKGIWGRIINIEEMTSLIQKSYPQCDFQCLDDRTPYSIYVVSKVLAETKLLVTCSGSIVHNSIFMHKNTGVVICGSHLIDYPEINIGYSLDIWMIHILGNYQHHTIPDIDYNIDSVIPAISYMLYAFENNKFPANAFKDYTYAYNITDITIMVQQEQKSNY